MVSSVLSWTKYDILIFDTSSMDMYASWLEHLLVSARASLAPASQARSLASTAVVIAGTSAPVSIIRSESQRDSKYTCM